MTRPNLTDRAKRYRANRNAPPGPRRCNFCTSRKNVDIDHISGDESDDEPENLMYLCRPCNTLKGFQQARNKIGVRTRQYNPEPRPTLEKFKHAAAILLGKIKGSVAQATAYIRSVAPEKRAEFAGDLAERNPFRSAAQRRKFFAMAERGEISQTVLKKFARDTPPGALPEHVNPFFGPQSRFDPRKYKGAAYGLEVDVTGRGRWEEQGLYRTKTEAEKEGRAIRKKEGMDYRVKVTRDTRNPPTFRQYAHGVAIHQRKAHDEGGVIIHSTPPELRSKYARIIASIKRQRGTA